MRLIGPQYAMKKEIIHWQANDDYNDILKLTEDINSFLDDRCNFWLDEMCIYLDLEKL
jgi:hypothetical protein